jgi:hypothetical protein
LSEGHVADANLIQHDRCATHRIARVFSQHQEGQRLGLTIAQVHNASPCVTVVVEMWQATPTGVLHLVFGYLKAQAITIELQ